jgi:hypothetical protein
MVWFALIVAINVETSASLMILQGGLDTKEQCVSFSQKIIRNKLAHKFRDITYGCYTEKQLLGQQPI